MKRKEDLDIIIPIELEPIWTDKEHIIAGIRELHDRYQYDHFTLFAPDKGWRSDHYPSKEYYEELGRLFKEIRDELQKEGIVCGWWSMLTMKGGPIEGVTRITREDGSVHFFANCPMDPEFRRVFAENHKAFCAIAHPEHIIFEDDYSINAAAFGKGCFCEHHLAEFNRRENASYTPESLSAALDGTDPESIELIRRWRALQKESLVDFAKSVRAAVDEVAPEVPIGLMQAGACDIDGDFTEDVCAALAGPAHTPFCRFYGTSYNGIDIKNLAGILFHPLYFRQHIQRDFVFLHESDTYPQTRFFMAGSEMRSLMSLVYSYGFDGSTFQTQQLLDDPNEDPVYAKMFQKERKRFNAIRRSVRNCRISGVGIKYDPFYNTLPGSHQPDWLYALGNFGIPYTTEDSAVLFWDDVNAKYATEEEIEKALSGGLFLDAAAAKVLSDRGYGADIGVEVGEPAAPVPVCYDLCSQDVIREPFRFLSKGFLMPSGHAYTAAPGTTMKLQILDPAVEVIAEQIGFKKDVVCPTMTRFENKRGGRVIVYGTTIHRNRSNSFLNYRRQRLFQYLISWCNDRYAYVVGDACVQTVMNVSKKPETDGFLGLLTMVNVGTDTIEGLSLHLPAEWRDKAYELLDRNGEWQPVSFEKTEEGIRLLIDIEPQTPYVVKVK